ncbi:MAG: trypsin-like peptidase domain-containing protein [Planctomycetota bacterium]
MKRSSLIFLSAFLLGAFLGPTLIRGSAGARSGPPALKVLAPRGVQERLKPEPPLALSESNPRVTRVVLAVRKAGPSVVNIQVGDRIGLRNGDVQLRKLGEGSGVIVDEDGLIITNWHVIRYRDQVADFYCRISLRDGRRFFAKVLSASRENDLALLVVDAAGSREQVFPPIAMADSEQLMVGETVIAIGNPHGQANSVTSGVLSAIGRNLRVVPPGERKPITFAGLLQTDAAINPGNSGGALLDVTGKLIGINTLMQTGSENIGFAIPVNRVKRVFESTLLSFDRIDKFWTGLQVSDGSTGLRVTGVTPGGPGALAGFRLGDRILRIGDKEVHGMKEFTKALITFPVGRKIPFVVSDPRRTRRLTLEPWSKTQAALFRLAGVVVEDFDARDRRLLRDIARYFSMRRWGQRLSPVRVSYIQEGGPGEELGLERGDLIVGRRVPDFWEGEVEEPLVGQAELVSWFQRSRGRRLEILVYRPGNREPMMAGKLEIR